MNGKIEQLIINEQYEEAWFAIAAYEENCPQDSDIDTYKFICLSNADEPQMALQYAYAAMQKQPYVADVHYNCAYAYQLCGQYFQAYEQYAIAKELALGGNQLTVSLEKIESAM